MSEFTFPDAPSECECCLFAFHATLDELCLARSASDLVACTRLELHRGPHVAHGVRRHHIVLAWANRPGVGSESPRLPLEEAS